LRNIAEVENLLTISMIFDLTMYFYHGKKSNWTAKSCGLY